jgi:hypothetical protein
MDEDRGRSKRTYILPNALLRRLESAAANGRRPVGRQLEVILEEWFALQDSKKSEKKPGQRVPTPLATQLV